MTNFETPVQYDVALCDDAIVRGELRFAARHRGDRAARQALKQWREDNPPVPREPRDTGGTGGVGRGAAMFVAGGRKPAGYDRPDDAA